MSVSATHCFPLPYHDHITHQLTVHCVHHSRLTTVHQLDPEDKSSRELKGMIEQAIDKDGKIGLAVVGGVLAAAAATVLVLFKRR